MPRYRLDVAYDGGPFHGFARQPGQATVQGKVESALGRVLGTSVETTGAGRTDAGVHARGQVMTFDHPEPLDLARTREALDALVGPEIAVRAVSQVAPDFDARFSAAWRRYRYLVNDAPFADPLTRGFVWHLGVPLDLGTMNEATLGLLGEHDFASFCRAKEGRSTVREVLEAAWRREDVLVFEIRATSFCHQMVRSLVGFLVEVGRGRFPAGRMGEVLEARDRSTTRSTVAPPHGLILWEVGYE